jgi:translocation and assembly module TamB
LRSQEQQELAAFGEIQVAKGQYSSYGVKLDIARGALYFSGSALTRPTLDILATRSIGKVSAGVKVGGTPDRPEVELYSVPTMTDSDILSYIVLGRPVGGQGGDNDLLLTAAGALLSQGESVALQEKLKGRLGLDVIEVDSGSGDVEDASITTGKYLTPDLYVSLGYSLFKQSNEVNLRYRLAPNWELESSIGVESGIDLYHLIEIE